MRFANRAILRPMRSIPQRRHDELGGSDNSGGPDAYESATLAPKSGLGLKLQAVWTAALALILWGLGWSGTSSAAETGGGSTTSGPVRRVWTQSRIRGTPEPTPPYTVERVFEKLALKNPIFITPEPGTGGFVLVDRGAGDPGDARVRRVNPKGEGGVPEVLVSMTNRQIYSVAFHPRYASNGYFYVFHNGPTDQPERTNRISRFTVDRARGGEVRAESERVVIEWRSAGHDGGGIAFGPDGLCYITSGDGTSDSDAWVSGQDLTTLLAGVLRIDVDDVKPGSTYRVPEDNPFWSIAGARPEKWAYGFRNPWRMSIDSKTGDVWVGNNGQDLWETAQLARRGENYGWSVLEGSHPFYAHRPKGPTPFVRPTIEHSHAEFRSLTGGFVVRGGRDPELEGVYVYGDYATGRIWGARHDGARVVWLKELADTSLQIVCFAPDHQGGVLVLDYAGGIFRLVPQSKRDSGAGFPRRLSETGLFASTPHLETNPGVIRYDVNVPGWVDGARSHRWLALPGESAMRYSSPRGWDLPEGAVVVQTLSMEGTGGGGANRRIETRLLVREQGEYAGYSYRWNSEQTDAELVAAGGFEETIETYDKAQNMRSRQSWRFPSRAECLMCHSRAANFVLGLSEAQMNRDFPEGVGEGKGNQIEWLVKSGCLTNAPVKPVDELARLIRPNDSTAPLEVRARSYLHVNCSPCHVEAGGGNAKMELGFATELSKARLIGARPQHDAFGITNAMLVAPGNPEASVVMRRLGRRGAGQMPPLVSRVVDEQALRLMRDWIGQLKPERQWVREWRIADLEPRLGLVGSGRSFETGRTIFRDVGCVQCHRFAGEGGSVGPDLAGLSKRAQPRQVLESILEPSKVLVEGYAMVELELMDGTTLSGRVEKETDTEIWLRPNAVALDSTRILKHQIGRRGVSSISNMPSGVVDVLREAEILDLLAYLLSDGDAGASAFR